MSRLDYDTWFVYELIDPRSKAVFYIGKTATPRGRLSQHKSDRTSAAYPRIREIRQAGHEVEMYCIGRFNTEAEAFDYEGYLIRKTPNLVNRAGYMHPTGPFVRPRLAVEELVYTSEHNQPFPDEETIAASIGVVLPHIGMDTILAVLRAKASLFDVDMEYAGVTDE